MYKNPLEILLDLKYHLVDGGIIVVKTLDVKL
jgi:hypothetical protein